jgi:hypothetical protein
MWVCDLCEKEKGVMDVPHEIPIYGDNYPEDVLITVKKICDDCFNTLPDI